LSAVAPLLAGAAAGYAIAIPVGPVAVLIVDGGIRHGTRHALAAGLGVALADALYATVAVVAGGAVARLLEPVTDAVRIASGIALLVVGLVLLRTALRPPATVAAREAPRPRATTARFLALTIVNPPTAIYFASLVLGLPAVASGTAAERTVFVLAAFLASLSWQSGLALVGGLARHRLPPGARRATGVIGAVVTLALAGRILLG